MDPRVRTHAETILDHCVEVEPGEEVLIWASPAAGDLVTALYERLGARNAFPMTLRRAGDTQRAFLREFDPETVDEPPSSLRRMFEAVDAVVNIRASTNTHAMSDVPPATNSAYARLMQPLQDLMLDERWTATQHPTPGDAQAAEMSTAAYAEFVYGAVNRDWAAQRAFQEQLVERLDPASEVRVVAGETTDIRMSVDGMVAVNDDARMNLPGGEVFTAPVPESVEGEVLFDLPVRSQGREIRDARLVFEDGEVIEHGAASHEEVLTSVLETDAGARRLGELGIGMNRAIDTFTANMLFDEKMGDTVHLALGRAHEESVGPARTANESAIHLDMLVDMSSDARIEIDGEVVQQDGTFVFEEEATG